MGEDREGGGLEEWGEGGGSSKTVKVGEKEGHYATLFNIL